MQIGKIPCCFSFGSYNGALRFVDNETVEYVSYIIRNGRPQFGNGLINARKPLAELFKYARQGSRGRPSLHQIGFKAAREFLVVARLYIFRLIDAEPFEDAIAVCDQV